MTEEKKEMVNHPNHYGGDTEYECIKVLKAWNTPEEFVGFCKDNAIKYLCRSGKKDEVLQEYADPDSPKYEKMVDEICKELHFTTLRFNRLDDMLDSVGIDKCKLCTYCWDGKE